MASPRGRHSLAPQQVHTLLEPHFPAGLRVSWAADAPRVLMIEVYVAMWPDGLVPAEFSVPVDILKLGNPAQELADMAEAMKRELLYRAEAAGNA